LLAAVVVVVVDITLAQETGAAPAVAPLAKTVTALTIPHIGEEVVHNQLLVQQHPVIAQTIQCSKVHYKAARVQQPHMVAQVAVDIGADPVVAIVVGPVLWVAVAEALAT
jgi:hypothetical protein